jgi:hypothetical protein
MALVVIDPTAVCEFSVEKETVKNRTVFLVSALDPFTLAYVNDRAMVTNVVTRQLDVNLGMRNVLIAQFGLRGWRNLLDRNGAEVPFATETLETPVGSKVAASSESMKVLPLRCVAKIAAEIERRSGIEGEDEKN